MKNLRIKAIAALAVGLISYSAMAQTDNIPQPVTSAFNAKYPMAKAEHWKMKNDTCMAMFKMNSREYKACYLPDGTWISSERNIKHMATLPMRAQTFMKTSKYASWHVDDLEKMQTPMQTLYVVQIDNHSGNPTNYEDGSDASKMLYFNANGRLVKTN